MSPSEHEAREEEERIRRAAQRAGYHLVKAIAEVLAAVSAALEELRPRDSGDEDAPVVHFEVE